MANILSCNYLLKKIVNAATYIRTVLTIRKDGLYDFTAPTLQGLMEPLEPHDHLCLIDLNHENTKHENTKDKKRLSGLMSWPVLPAAKEVSSTGMGLVNVRRNLRRRDGAVWAEGEIGRGATLCFPVPANPGEEVRYA